MTVYMTVSLFVYEEDYRNTPGWDFMKKTEHGS